MEHLEIRSSGAVRATAGRLEGYASIFNAEANLGGFVEVVRAGAFQKSLASGRSISALYDHRGGALLGTTRSGTLQLTEDSKGLKFSLALPSTSYGTDVGILVDRGDIQGCSFGFQVPEGGDTWTERDNGEWLRELRSVELHEITITPNPAYASTEVALRSLRAIHDDRSFDDFTRNPLTLWMQTV